jgi:hypothetical protein
MNRLSLKILSFVLIIIGIMGALWLDQTKGVGTPLLWFTHVGVFLALVLLAFEGVGRAIAPLLLWIAAYGYTMIAMQSLLNLEDMPFTITGSEWEMLLITPALAVAATVATGIALFIPTRPKKQ